MRLGLLFVSLLSLPVAAQEPRASKPRVSSNGLYTAQFFQWSPDRCRLELRKEDGPVWSVSRCVGEVDDLYFPSADGSRVWVLRPLPRKGQKKAGALPAWTNTVVAWQLDSKGTQVQEKRLPDLMSRRGMGEVRQLGGHFKWLEGTLGIPGKGPRLTEAGVVEFDTVAGEHQQLSF